MRQVSQVFSGLSTAALAHITLHTSNPLMCRLALPLLPSCSSATLHTTAPVLPSHLSAIMNTCLALASGHAPPATAAAAGHKAHTAAAADNDEQQHDPREEAAAEAALAVALAVDEDSLPSLVSELLGALEDVGGRALGACRLISAYARGTRHDLEDHADELLTVRGWGGGVGCLGWGRGEKEGG